MSFCFLSISNRQEKSERKTIERQQNGNRKTTGKATETFKTTLLILVKKYRKKKGKRKVLNLPSIAVRRRLWAPKIRIQCIKAPTIARVIPNGEESPAIPMRQRTAKTIPMTKEAWTLSLQQQGILENLQKQNKL